MAPLSRPAVAFPPKGGRIQRPGQARSADAANGLAAGAATPGASCSKATLFIANYQDTTPTQARFHSRPRGFTLIEVLVALSIMAVMAVLTWRGIDGMSRGQEVTRRYTDDVLALQAGLSQWKADLDAMLVWPGTPTGALAEPMRGLLWDGSTLRVTRSEAADGPQAQPATRVVAWTRRPNGAWERWQSPPIRGAEALVTAWQQAALWGQGATPMAGSSVVRVALASDWLIHYYRNNAWSNPLSSSDNPQPQTDGTGGGRVPDGVRLMLTLAPGQAIAGPITLDWVRPTLGGDL